MHSSPVNKVITGCLFKLRLSYFILAWMFCQKVYNDISSYEESLYKDLQLLVMEILKMYRKCSFLAIAKVLVRINSHMLTLTLLFLP